MMRGSLFNPSTWSLGAKVVAALVALAALVILITGAVSTRSIQEVNLDSGRLLVEQTGARQAAVVASAISAADSAVRRFTVQEQARLFGLLLADVRVNDSVAFPQSSTSEVANLLRNELLALPASLFENVRLVDRNGRVLAQAARSVPLSGDPIGARAPAYIAAINGAIRGEDRVLSVSQVNFTPIVEQTEILRWRDQTPIGFLVVRLNNRRIFFDPLTLAADNNPFRLRSFIVTANGVLITPDGVRPESLRAADSLAAGRAIEGEIGSDIYSADDGIEYVGYYAPIRGAPLALVTQASTSDARARYDVALTPRRIATAVGLLAIMVFGGLLIAQLVIPSLNRLRRSVQSMAYGNLDADIPETGRKDEIGALASNIQAMRDQVRGQIDTLEISIADRVRDLDATQEISRFAATQRDLQRLMDSVVNLIIDRFGNIYHAQIFLLDADAQDALLRASTGTVGAELLRRGHRLGVGSVSVIGQVTSQGRIVIARDTAVNPVHKRNEFLPDTRAELAVPLRVATTIIGALDVQSRERDAFNEEQVDILQTMADQIAVAIQNARLYEDVNRRLQDIEERNRRATVSAWQDYMQERRRDSIVRESGIASEFDHSDLKEAASLTGELVVGRVTPRQTIPIAVPIVLRGQVLGIVEWEMPVGVLSEDKLELARELAGRLAISLDNARLFQETQRTAERERVVNSIVANLTAQTNIDDILQTAVREVGQALRAPQVSIRLGGAVPIALPDTGTLKPESNGHST